VKDPQATDAETPAQKVARLEAERAARKKSKVSAADEQRAIDLEAINQLEIQLGDDNLAIVEVPHEPGCVTMVAARCPTSPETKRYRFRAKDKAGKRNDVIPGDPIEAAEELAESALKYPDAEAFAKVCAARPGLKAQLGALTITLVLGDAKS